MSSNSKQSRVSRPSERNLKDAATISVEENPCEEENEGTILQSQDGDSLALTGSIPNLGEGDIQLN